MDERQKLLYILVVPDRGHEEEKGSSSFSYTRQFLQSSLQMMGCKPRHAFKISKRVFNMLASESPSLHPVKEKILSSSLQNLSSHLSDSEIDRNRNYPLEKIKQTAEMDGIRVDRNKETLMSLKRKCSTAVISRGKFLDVVCEALSEYRYIGSNQRADLSLACRIRERRKSMTILLCGTSGCGKSTLSTLLASRLGITTVVSTDSIRHMIRSFVDEKDNPLLWASTYHAGEYLDLAAVAQSKVKKNTKRMSGILPGNSVGNKTTAASPNVISKNFHSGKSAEDFNEPHGQLMTKRKTSEASVNATTHEAAEILVSEKMLAVQGYKAQCEMVIDSLDRLITSWEQRCESVIVEGVHLSLNFVMGLMKKHPSIIPFMVFIENEEKHLQRFAVRAKYMTLDPSKNKYVKYIRNIRTIQEYLCKRADKHLVPKVNNTNVDKSIVAIHATIFSCLRRMDAGEQLYDPISNTMKLLDQEYQNQCNANYFGSKRMLQLIQRRGSSRQLVVLVNGDGSVARAWPFEVSDNKSVPSSTCFNGSAGTPIYGLPSIGKGQPVNLQFGNFGLSAFTSDLEGTSRTSSNDGLSMRGDGTEYESSHLSSSCSSSPKVGDGPDKELATVDTVSESEEEEEATAEDGGDPDSDEDLNTDTKNLEEDGAEGSVDEESIKSDEDEILDEQDDDGGAYWPLEGIADRNMTSEDKLDLAAADNSKKNSSTCYDSSYSSSFKGDSLTSHVDYNSSDLNHLSGILLK